MRTKRTSIGPGSPSSKPAPGLESNATNRRGATVNRSVQGGRSSLVVAARAGDKFAFGKLVSLEAQEGYRLSYGVLRNRVDAEDALQDAFLLAWRQLPRLRDPDSWSAWFRRLLVNSAIEVHRRRRRRTTVRLLSQEVPPIGDSSAQVAMEDEVDRLMGCLEPRDRVLIVLRYQQDLDLHCEYRIVVRCRQGGRPPCMGDTAMRALDCKHPAHEDMHATASTDEELTAKVRQHIAEVHPDMSPDQAKDIVAQGAYDE